MRNFVLLRVALSSNRLGIAAHPLDERTARWTWGRSLRKTPRDSNTSLRLCLSAVTLLSRSPLGMGSIAQIQRGCAVAKDQPRRTQRSRRGREAQSPLLGVLCGESSSPDLRWTWGPSLKIEDSRARLLRLIVQRQRFPRWAWGLSSLLGARARRRPEIPRPSAGDTQERIARTALDWVCMPLLSTSSVPSVVVSTRATVAVT